MPDVRPGQLWIEHSNEIDQFSVLVFVVKKMKFDEWLTHDVYVASRLSRLDTTHDVWFERCDVELLSDA